jgi:hypothetical protein
MKNTSVQAIYCVAALLGIAVGLRALPALADGVVIVDGKAVEGVVLEGSGVAASETRDVAEFKEISAGGATRVDVTVGPEMSIQVTADDNILPHIKTDVAKERLKIYVDESYSSKVGVDVKVTVPELRWLRGSGATKWKVAEARGEKFQLALLGDSKCVWKGEVDLLQVKLSGSSHATLAGKAGKVQFKLAGAANLEERELAVSCLKAELEGAAVARVQVADELSVVASGAARLTYSGDPKVNQKTSGAAGVVRE